MLDFPNFAHLISRSLQISLATQSNKSRFFGWCIVLTLATFIENFKDLLKLERHFKTVLKVQGFVHMFSFSPNR
jgi:hypothetical protein